LVSPPAASFGEAAALVAIEASTDLSRAPCASNTTIQLLEAARTKLDPLELQASNVTE
jgi:hypothetical protein